MAQKILITDDDPTQRRLLEATIERMGYETVQADGGQAAIDYLESDAGEDIGLVMLDLVMPDVSGHDVLERINPKRPDLPMIVLTAQGGIETVVNAMKAGAVDFFVKPASPERIKVGIENAIKIKTLVGEVKRLNKRKSGLMTFDDLVTNSAAMHQVIRLGERAAASNIPILIEGESGVGKEVIARAIQGQSDRAGRPFVTVNCGAIPENLVESILFGHEKGSFTGAAAKHLGKFQEANGGTIFLDEIGELPLDMQVKLLRVLQEGEVDAIGSKKPVKIDVRVISATNKDLLARAQSGDFREDLYYRLNVFPIGIPPLRERTGDIALLGEYFIERFAAEENKTITGMDDAALSMLTSYSWPGNVRELENTLFRAVVLADSERLTVHDFPQIQTLLGIPSQPAASPDALDVSNSGIISQTSAPSNQDDDGAIQAVDPMGHLRKLEDIEGEMIQLAIDVYSGHMSEVARRLGIGRSTLYRKVRELGLEKKASGE